jgi:hypothetical protein
MFPIEDILPQAVEAGPNAAAIDGSEVEVGTHLSTLTRIWLGG